MSRRYDSSTTTFSPEGRVLQVEYAVEAINNAGTCVGLQGGTGLVLAAELKTSAAATSALLAPSRVAEKTYQLDDHIACVVAGLTADAGILIGQARLMAQRHRYTYGEPMPVEMLVKRLCDYKQAYTQFGGLRPFGVSFLFAGWDAQRGLQLYYSDPSGNYNGWKATAIGQNNGAGKSLLKSEYADDMSMDECMALAAKTLLKTMDTTTPEPEKVEFSVLTHDAESGTVSFEMVGKDKVRELLEAAQQEEEANQETQGDA